MIKEARQRDRVLGRGFSNSQLQATLGQRGGQRGGLANTPDQFNARQQVGLEFGRQTGLANQSPNLKYFVSCHSIWSYSNAVRIEGNRASRSDARFYLVTPKRGYVDILRWLLINEPGTMNPDTFNTMNKLVTNREQTKQLNGWKIVSMLTRSEVRAGIEDFFIQNPDQNLVFDPDFDSALLMNLEEFE